MEPASDALSVADVMGEHSLKCSCPKSKHAYVETFQVKTRGEGPHNMQTWNPALRYALCFGEFKATCQTPKDLGAYTKVCLASL